LTDLSEPSAPLMSTPIAAIAFAASLLGSTRDRKPDFNPLAASEPEPNTSTTFESTAKVSSMDSPVCLAMGDRSANPIASSPKLDLVRSAVLFSTSPMCWASRATSLAGTWNPASERFITSTAAEVSTPPAMAKSIELLTSLIEVSMS